MSSIYILHIIFIDVMHNKEKDHNFANFCFNYLKKKRLYKISTVIQWNKFRKNTAEQINRLLKQFRNINIEV